MAGTCGKAPPAARWRPSARTASRYERASTSATLIFPAVEKIESLAKNESLRNGPAVVPRLPLRPMIGQVPRRLNNLWWEHRLGISTRGVVPVAHYDSTHYATMSYSTIWSILDHLSLGPSDVFVDIGSGRGRVLCCAAQYPVERVVGVDLSEPLCEAARENARRLRGRRAPISVQASMADDFAYSAATVLFRIRSDSVPRRSLVSSRGSVGRCAKAFVSPTRIRRTTRCSSGRRGLSPANIGTRPHPGWSTLFRSTGVAWGRLIASPSGTADAPPLAIEQRRRRQQNRDARQRQALGAPCV